VNTATSRRRERPNTQSPEEYADWQETRQILAAKRKTDREDACAVAENGAPTDELPDAWLIDSRYLLDELARLRDLANRIPVTQKKPPACRVGRGRPLASRAADSLSARETCGFPRFSPPKHPEHYQSHRCKRRRPSRLQMANVSSVVVRIAAGATGDGTHARTVRSSRALFFS
jgi:hypothetical protein